MVKRNAYGVYFILKSMEVGPTFRIISPPLLQRLALPVTIGSVRYPGIKIHDSRIIRLLEVLLHGGTTIGGWTAKQLHEAVLTTFDLTPGSYGLNQLRYDLRKLKGNGLLQRDGNRYAYRQQAEQLLAQRQAKQLEEQLPFLATLRARQATGAYMLAGISAEGGRPACSADTRAPSVVARH
jgi:hypothetical protein